MNVRILEKQRVFEWIEGLQGSWRVVGPRGSNGGWAFDEIRSADEIALDYPTTILPPKKALLPTRQVLFNYREGRPEICRDAVPTVLLGVHTCDLHALTLLDRAYGGDPPDPLYRAQRAETAVVGLECLRPCSDQAFCKSMGTLAPPDGTDLHLTDLGDAYAVEIGSDQGRALLEDSVSLPAAAQDNLRRLDRVMGEKWARFPNRLDFDVSQLPALMLSSRGSDLWTELAARCLGCGACTLVCPTCTCFDVRDEMDLSLESGSRVRVWDSCQIASFAVVAGGHNFRADRAGRLRHRFLRKGRYQMKAFGLPGCVGCGRCATACLARITPIETYNALYRRMGEARPTAAEVVA